jgi:hypothetical protein
MRAATGSNGDRFVHPTCHHSNLNLLVTGPVVAVEACHAERSARRISQDSAVIAAPHLQRTVPRMIGLCRWGALSAIGRGPRPGALDVGDQLIPPAERFPIT